MIRAALAALALAAIGSAGAASAPALAQSADPAARAVAMRLIETMKVMDQLDQAYVAMTPMMAKSAMAQIEVNPSSRSLFEQLTKGEYARKQKLEAIIAEEYLAAMRAQLPRLKAEYAREYAATFTIAEMETLNGYFAQGAGAKFIAQSAALQTRLGAIGQRIGMEVGAVAMPKAIERARAELEAETNK
jgi:hypothetical protein